MYKLLSISAILALISTSAFAAPATLTLKRGDYVSYIAFLRNEQAQTPEPFAIFCMVNDEALKTRIKSQNPFLASLRALGVKVDPNTMAGSIDMTAPGSLTVRLAPGDNNHLEIICGDTPTS